MTSRIAALLLGVTFPLVLYAQTTELRTPIVPSTGISYAQTAAEAAAGVTPSNFSFAPYDIRRYGALGDNSTDNTAALANAALVLAKSGVIDIYNTGSSYNYVTSPNWDVGNGLRIIGHGNPILKCTSCTGATPAFDMHSAAFGTTTDGQNEEISGITVYGNDSFTTQIVYNISGIMRSTFTDLVADHAQNTVNTLSGCTITGTAGQFSCTASNIYVGMPVVISGTFGGTGSITGYSNPTTYFISTTNGSTTFTLKTHNGQNGVAIVTTAGTPTGLTYTTNVGGIGFLLTGAISDTVIRPFVSGNGGGSAHLPYDGMVMANYPGTVTGNSANVIIDPVFENEGVGINMTDAARTIIQGGTSEAMSDVGIYEGEAGSSNNLVLNVDLEANTNADIESWGRYFQVQDSIGTLYKFGANQPHVLHDNVTTITMNGCFTADIIIEQSNYTTLNGGCGGAVYTLGNLIGGGYGADSIGNANASVTLNGSSATVSSTLNVTGALTAPSALVSGTAGIGYATGAGGTVTQITSRTTGVTINKTAGAITLFSAAGSATAATFTVTDSTVAATDTIVLNQKSGTNLYELFVTAVTAGTFNITFLTTGGTATDAPVINFTVIKGVTS